MKTDELRKKFLNFFESKGHKIVSSDTLVPKEDPTVLFTSAGMNQFKDYFLGLKKDIKRAASCQKCFRTADLENVGRTASHHTFFEMLGNFSFGDYFKSEAIQWAWEFMTEVLGLKDEDLWVSVYEEDQEAYDIWARQIKVPEGKILKFGGKENFWPSEAKEKGPNGPCGPCSEIFFDQGQDVGCGRSECSPACDCGRFVEVWNLVFTQFDRKEGGLLAPLPNKNIDTGMGLERLAAVMQGVHTNFQNDLFSPIVGAIERLVAKAGVPMPHFGSGTEARKAGQLPGKEAKSQVSRQGQQAIYTIADHIRAITFLVADGILPSNEARGYVLRMLIRRAARFGRQLGLEKPFLYKLVPAVARVTKSSYPELDARRENISQIVLSEEKRFLETLDEGMDVLKSLMSQLKKSGSNRIPGELVFKLYDTYGFPHDLTESVAGEEGFQIDREGFEAAMEKQRELSRAKSAMTGLEIFAQTVSGKLGRVAKATKFTGYENYEVDTKVLAIIRSEEFVDEAQQGQEVWVVLEESPFYGEAGGQVGDKGIIKKLKVKGKKSKAKRQKENRKQKEEIQAKLEVQDTKIFDKIIVHISKVRKGKIKVEDKVHATIDRDRRLDIARNHTATHLLQNALRTVLGPHVQQSGSLVDEDRLRFDFTHFKSIAQQQLDRVEELVNQNIRRDDEVRVKFMDLEEARRAGAIALFGEKYEKKVRMVSIGDYSKELCGGTHLSSIGQIGTFKIENESSISAGVRRIQALTGAYAYKRIKKDEEILRELSATFKISPEGLVGHLEQLSLRHKTLEKQLKQWRLKASRTQIEQIISKALDVEGVKLIASEVEAADLELLRSMGDSIKSKLGSGVVILGSKSKDKVFLITAITKDLVSKNLHAGKIVNEIARLVGGGGGGRPDFAQAGGKNPAGLVEALKKAAEIISSIVHSGGVQ